MEIIGKPLPQKTVKADDNQVRSFFICFRTSYVHMALVLYDVPSAVTCLIIQPCVK